MIDCDLLVVGGGINGVGIARDAAGRGLSVVLCEKDDLASHTSSAATKLIHGGLRYLEYYEFGLVRKSLIEREVLLRAAPHIMWPIRFVTPVDKRQRPAWMIRAGLFLYDHLARRKLLPGSHGIDLRKHAAGGPLKPQFKRGFVYSDGWVDDARLVVLNAIDAAEKGARIFTRTGCESAVPQDGRWHATLRPAAGEAIMVNARCLINAAGPWAAHFLQTAVRRPSEKSMRLIKGSHIVVRKLFDHPYAYIFQHPDGRVVFAIPYEHDFTLIGTTDLEYRGDAGKVAIDQDEIAYLCELSSRYFQKPITPADVVWSYSGVRPLVEDESSDASGVTRDYRLDFDHAGAPMLSIFGGKITTFRKLAEEAVDMIAPKLGNRQAGWTADACMPGGDLFGAKPVDRSVLEFAQYVEGLQQQYHWLPAKLVARYARAYGTRIHTLLMNRKALADMGEEIATGLFLAEVIYLIEHEWATCATDILWRRSKLGLHLPREREQTLDAWIDAQRIGGDKLAAQA
ncbi:MAG: glycerol-3-phosphate dehydrogenase [Burkholderiales bacterium RIFCSPLOWO2_02_FULL_57_36]|nr:MAG: glycerol-3-phosphate dehydrogenase [Burkholderiales bacterium RIFCSPLOWO2_02_FULL_57_36]